MITFALFSVPLLLASPQALPWHGFPVYPPGQTQGLAEEGGFTRLEVVPLLDAAASRPTPAEVRAAKQEARKAARTEVRALLEWLPGEARRAGWTVVRADTRRDCHREWVFARIDDRLRVVRVALWNDLGRAEGAPGWGTLEYRYQEGPRPHLERGFPLCADALPAGAVSEEQGALGPRLVLDDARCPARDEALPAYAGFVRQGTGQGPFLWRKGDLRVLQERLPGKTACTFVAPEREAEALRKVPTAEEYGADVDPSDECL